MSDEKLDTQHTHHAQLFEHAARQFHGFVRHTRRHASRRDRNIQDVPSVLILDGAVMHERAIAAARADHGAPGLLGATAIT